MHPYHKQAELLAKSAIEDLQRIVGKGDNNSDDISRFNPCVVNSIIDKIINIKILLACANEVEGRNFGTFY